MRYNNSNKKNAFTLIELLVVLVIITILAALLMPSLRIARETARCVQCLSNEKQIYLAFGYYAENFEGYIPQNTVTSATGNYWWAYFAVTYLDGCCSAKVKTINDFDSGLVGTPMGVYKCPSESRETTGVLTKWNTWKGIQYNLGRYVGMPYDPNGTNYSTGKYWVKLSQIPSPSRVGFLMDAQPGQYSYIDGSYNTMNAYRSTMFRHLDRINSGYVDGHGRSLNWMQWPNYDYYLICPQYSYVGNYYERNIYWGKKDFQQYWEAYSY